jgi:cell wall hydrolase
MKLTINKVKSICISLSLFYFLSILPINIVNAKSLDGNKAKSLYKEKMNTIAVFNSQNKNVCVTENDIDLMAQVVYAESRGEPYEGKVAVASVILNRLKNANFPMSIDKVIKQNGAFSCVNKGSISIEPDEESYFAVYDALKGLDPTCKSLYFYNPEIATCNWMKNIEKSNKKVIGNHIFFIAN